jgi:probable phosphoglycerate mutase
MTEIILARHGETEWNVGQIFRGRIDVDLNQTGMEQARLLGQYLSKRKIEAVFPSPLKRALKTAEAIAGPHHLKVEVSLGLIDFDFGQWQGLAMEQVIARYPELHRQWLDSPDRVTMPEGERLDDVKNRALVVVNESIERYENTVVLVSHRVVHKVLICALLGLDNSYFWNIKLDTCGITTFDYENGRFILAEHNNTSFLAPLRKAPLGDF